MTRGTTSLLAVVGLALLTIACNNGESSADPTEATTATTASRTTATPTTSAPTTTHSPSTTAPSTTVVTVPTTTPLTEAPSGSEDWMSIIQAFATTINSLYAAPDLARIPEVCAVGSNCEEHLHAQLSDMISQGARIVDDPPLKVLSTEVVPNSYDGPTVAESLVVDIDVVFQVPPDAAGRVVDAAGNTMYVLDYRPPRGETYTSRWTLFRPELIEPWRQSFFRDTIP